MKSQSGEEGAMMVRIISLQIEQEVHLFFLLVVEKKLSEHD